LPGASEEWDHKDYWSDDVIRRFLGQHPVLSTLIFLPIAFPLLFLAGLILLMLLDALLIPFGLEAGFVYRLFIAPAGGFAAALFGCAYLVLYIREQSQTR
jgi:hypothetical protein